VFSNDCPNEAEVDSKILVDDDVSKCDDLSPGNFAVGLTQLDGYRSARLAKQGQAVQDGALNQDIAKENVMAGFRKPADQLDLFERI
jgi:hypothetical protein